NPTRKDTQVPQPSGPTKSVTDEAVHKELDDSLVRAATTASSLEAKRDSGGGPRCQETMWDITAQTRVLDLEKKKTTQHNGIASLKRKVKKLKKRNMSRTHKLKRLYKVGLTARLESSNNEESLGEDASKQEMRIDAINANDEITLVNDADNEMFDVDDLGGAEAFVAEQEVVSTAGSTETITTEEITWLKHLKHSKLQNPRKKELLYKSQVNLQQQYLNNIHMTRVKE
nr:hypothetical protein [Tanacetum cinerariifolium]